MTDILCNCDDCIHISPNGKCLLDCIDIDDDGRCCQQEENNDD